MDAKPVFLAASAWLGVAAPAQAQQSAAGGQTCVQVEIAGRMAGTLNCLNQQLRNQAMAAEGEAVPAAPLGAGSPSNAVGLFNQFGVAEQYGRNFGVSVLPYRPPPPVYGGGVN